MNFAWLKSYCVQSRSGLPRITGKLSPTLLLPQTFEEIWHVAKYAIELLQLESALNGCITAQFSNLNAQEQRRLQKVVNIYTSASVVLPSPPVKGSTGSAASGKQLKWSKTHTTLTSLLLLGRKNRSLRTVASGFKNSCFPTTIRFLNHPIQHQTTLYIAQTTLACTIYNCKDEFWNPHLPWMRGKRAILCLCNSLRTKMLETLRQHW